jgi:hypothetical protein
VAAVRLAVMADTSVVVNPTVRQARGAKVDVLYAGTGERATLLQVRPRPPHRCPLRLPPIASDGPRALAQRPRAVSAAAPLLSRRRPAPAHVKCDYKLGPAPKSRCCVPAPKSRCCDIYKGARRAGTGRRVSCACGGARDRDCGAPRGKGSRGPGQPHQAPAGAIPCGPVRTRLSFLSCTNRRHVSPLLPTSAWGPADCGI